MLEGKVKEKRSRDCALGILSSTGQGAEDRAGIRHFQSQSRELNCRTQSYREVLCDGGLWSFPTGCLGESGLLLLALAHLNLLRERTGPRVEVN